MDLGQYFHFEITKFLKTINYKGHISINIHSGYNRCMARVWDPVDWDINKRCLRSSISNQLCGIHIKKLSSGRVDEYPSEKIVLRAYRKHKPNIDTLIDIKHKSFYTKLLYSSNKNNLNLNFNINLKTKKNIKYNSKMSLESISNLNHIISSYDTNNKDELRLKVIKDLKEKHNFYVSIAEDKILKNKIENYIKHKVSNIENEIEDETENEIEDETENEIEDTFDNYSSLDTININTLETIKIIDTDHNDQRLFILDDKEGYIRLYNDTKNLAGYYRHWIDDDDEVPYLCKTQDGKVLHPDTKLPIIEVEITKQGSIYTGLIEGIYREYEYDEIFETFRNTNQIYQ